MAGRLRPPDRQPARGAGLGLFAGRRCIDRGGVDCRRRALWMHLSLMEECRGRIERALAAIEEGTLFPWVVSDFSLMDAIECGIVKLPRIPVADNFAAADAPVYRNLWQRVGRDLLRTRHPLDLPAMLQTALYALYSNYETYHDEWDKHRFGVPPVFIVLCQNTANSRLVH